MLRRRAIAAVVLAGGCATADAPFAADPPPGAPLPSQIPSGQVPSSAPPSEPVGDADEHLLHMLGVYAGREGLEFSRVFRDTCGAVRGREASHAVPVQAGRCYRFVVATPAPYSRTVRLHDRAALLFEDRSAYGPLTVHGRTPSLCAARDGVWRLEAQFPEGTQRYCVSVIATGREAPPYQMGPRGRIPDGPL